MKKSLIIGLTTLTVVGSALIAGTMYAATGTNNSTNSFFGNNRMNHSQMMGGPENLVNSLSGKVSQTALDELKKLMDSHKTKMDALRSSSGTIDNTVMEALHTEQKTAMDALMIKYPELKTAIDASGAGIRKGMSRGGEMSGSGQMDQLFSGVSDADKTILKNIHDEYKTKIDALKTEEKTKMDTVFVKYPELKAKLDTMKSGNMQGDDREEGMGHRGKRGGGHMGSMSQKIDSSNTSTKAQ